MGKILRYHLEDKGQDLLYLDVKVSKNGIGIIVDTSPVPYKGLYVNKLVINGNSIGCNFKYINYLNINYVALNEDAEVRELKYKIESIEPLSNIL